MHNYEDVRELYQSLGFGGRVGFGDRPAIIVVDLVESMLDESNVLGSHHLEPVIASTVNVLNVARGVGVPIFFALVAFDDAGSEVAGPITKKKRYLSDPLLQARGTAAAILEPRLARRPEEIVVEKQRPSAFWGTPFNAYLIARRVDTLIIMGASTSGCIRSTAESSYNHNYHTIVVAEAVGDRSTIAHECNLIDIDLRWADVTGMDEVVGYLSGLSRAKPLDRS